MGGLCALYYIICVSLLELSGLGGAWEGDDIADVLHAGDEEDESFETETEACMGA